MTPQLEWSAGTHYEDTGGAGRVLVLLEDRAELTART
jgi:hypothetical protein